MDQVDDAFAMSPELYAKSQKLNHDQKTLLMKINKRKARDLANGINENRVYKEECVYCPLCGATMRPYVIADFRGNVDASKGVASIPLYCGACGQNMTPMVRAMKQYMKDMIALRNGQDVERITDEQVDEDNPAPSGDQNGS